MADFLSLEEKRGIQTESLRALIEIKRLCEKHGIKYYLTAGTLLGAVRHGGFIPWDDDIDVVMPRAEYKRFAKIAKRELGNEFFYQSSYTEKKYPFSFAKIRVNDTSVNEEILRDADMHNGCYADIFPLDVCPKNEKRAIRFFKLTTFFHCAVLSRVSRSFICGYERGAAKTAFSLARLLPIRVLKWLEAFVRIYYTHTSSEGKLCTVSGSYGYPRETYSSEWFSESVMLSFEGKDFPAPQGYRELLTNMYGDYMTPPPESERVGHFKKQA